MVPPYHRSHQCQQGQGESAKLSRARAGFAALVAQRTRRLDFQGRRSLGRFTRAAGQEGSARRPKSVFPRTLHLQLRAASGEAAVVAAGGPRGGRHVYE
jgi:hypothetical protein